MSAATFDKSGPQPSASGIAKALGQCLVSSVIFIDSDGQTATLCPEAANWLGVESHSCPAAALPATLVALAREVRLSGKPSGCRDIQVSLSHRAAGMLRVSAMPIGTGPSGWAVAMGLTQLARLEQCEEHLQQLERLANTGKLAASTAHEIRNALVAGKTFIELLLEKNRDAELGEVVAREVSRIDGLVSRLLRFPGAQKRTTAPVHLHQVLDYSLRLVQPQLTGKSISVERLFHASADLTQGDERALQQTFVNLLLNAVEAMSSHGKLTLQTQLTAAEGNPALQGSGIRVKLHDTGAGITPRNLEHLFEPFFTTKPGGTGLGLAIARQIIQDHGGTISVESSVGGGTTFWVLLPTAK